MKTQTFRMVADGKSLRLQDRVQFERCGATCAAGTEWDMTIKPKAKRQGSQTLRYLRGVVIPDIAEACGYSDPDDYQSVYNGLMWKLFRLEDGAFGEPRRRSFSKDETNQDEATEMVSRSIEHAESEIVGCRVRRPNEIDLDTVPMTWQPNDEAA